MTGSTDTRRFRVITFDLDDTLWDVRPALRRAEAAQNAWLQQHHPKALEGHSEASLNERKRALLKAQPSLIHHISRFRQTFLEQLLLDAGLAADEAQHAAAQAFEAFIARRHDVELFEHAPSVLTELNRHYQLGALTNGNAEVAKTPLAKFFQFAFKAEEVGAAKPDPALFHKALQHSGVSPEEMLHVGDSHAHDICGAQAAGIACIWLNSTGAPADGAPASAQIRCLSELPAALLDVEQRLLGQPQPTSGLRVIPTNPKF